MIRVDYLLSGGALYVNEINSVPGSMAYYLFCDTFAEFSRMLDELIAEALERFNRPPDAHTSVRLQYIENDGGKGRANPAEKAEI